MSVEGTGGTSGVALSHHPYEGGYALKKPNPWAELVGYIVSLGGLGAEIAVAAGKTVGWTVLTVA
jgi:hypothetical protein